LALLEELIIFYAPLLLCKSTFETILLEQLNDDESQIIGALPHQMVPGFHPLGKNCSSHFIFVSSG